MHGYKWTLTELFSSDYFYFTFSQTYSSTIYLFLRQSLQLRLLFILSSDKMIELKQK